MKIPFLMIFSFFGIISAWASKALQDGKISAQECYELVNALAEVLGVTLEFDVSEFLALSSPKANAEDIEEQVNPKQQNMARHTAGE
ncbi:MAG: hypothetical protein E3J94_01280 [Desulfobacteraceae bacterium]|nr:MAG: hypothetical protein E3J94_01280 [Desulfobacteraceae bacterium]